MSALQTLAVANYRSIRSLVMPLGPLNLIAGANGSGKSNRHRALRLLSDAARSPEPGPAPFTGNGVWPHYTNPRFVFEKLPTFGKIPASSVSLQPNHRASVAEN
jgi:hypothetical protein